MSTRTFLLATSSLLVLAACGPDSVRSVDDYDGVDNRTDATMRHVEASDSDGDAETVEIFCGDDDETANIDMYVQTDVDWNDGQGTLVIESYADVSGCEVVLDDSGLESVLIRGNGEARMEAPSSELSYIELEGSGDVYVNSTSTNAFDLWSRGSSKVTIDNVEVISFITNLSGTSEATVSGTADVAGVNMEGNSKLFAKDLVVANEANAEMSGNAEAELTVNGTLEAEVEGDATLEIWGDVDLTDIIEDGNGEIIIND